MEPTPASDKRSRHPGQISATKFVQRLKEDQDFAQSAMVSAQ